MIDFDLALNKNKFKNLEYEIICPICKGVLYEPMICNYCKNNFCQKCIKDNKCPFKCKSDFLSNYYLEIILSKILVFKCEFGCGEKISYNEYFNHEKKCKNVKNVELKNEYENLINEYLKKVDDIYYYNNEIQLYKIILNDLKNERKNIEKKVSKDEFDLLNKEIEKFKNKKYVLLKQYKNKFMNYYNEDIDEINLNKLKKGKQKKKNILNKKNYNEYYQMKLEKFKDTLYKKKETK